MLKNILSLIKQSTNNDNAVSSVRLQAYLMFPVIYIMVAVFIALEIAQFHHAITLHLPFVISNESIVIFGMVLSHHLAILFSRSKSQSIGELKGSSTDAVVDTTTATSDVPVVADTTDTTADDKPTEQVLKS